MRKVDELQKAVGRVEARQLLPDQQSLPSLQRPEFKVYSQWGEDGIIQHLIRSVRIEKKIFIEFGVQDYHESNTRFLLQNDNWAGLVIDASRENIQKIKDDPIYYRHNLRAVYSFVDRDNINEIIPRAGISGDIGLLSIDIDGNDYWVWESISCIQPRLVICEYDSLLGWHRAVTTPYDKSFDRTKAHYSFLYGGASLKALHLLAMKKGYALVGSNSAGNNAFFVRKDVIGSLKALTPEEAYVRAQFRNSKDSNGRLTFLSFEESLALIGDLQLVDLEKGGMIKVKDLSA